MKRAAICITSVLFSFISYSLLKIKLRHGRNYTQKSHRAIRRYLPVTPHRSYLAFCRANTHITGRFTPQSVSKYTSYLPMAHSPWQRDIGTPMNLAQVYQSLGLESDEATYMLSVVCPCHSMLIIRFRCNYSLFVSKTNTRMKRRRRDSLPK